MNGGELSSKKEVDEEYFVEEYDTDPKEIKVSDRLGSYPTMADIYERKYLCRLFINNFVRSLCIWPKIILWG